MKNIFIIIVLGFIMSSCSQSKYQNIDSQYANNSNSSIQAKYNNKNLIQEDKRKKDLVRQIALIHYDE